jgi:hypothetical protein
MSAQQQKMELDKLVIVTDVTRKTVEQTEVHARDGAYVVGSVDCSSVVFSFVLLLR